MNHSQGHCEWCRPRRLGTRSAAAAGDVAYDCHATDRSEYGDACGGAKVAAKASDSWFECDLQHAKKERGDKERPESAADAAGRGHSDEAASKPGDTQRYVGEGHQIAEGCVVVEHKEE